MLIKTSGIVALLIAMAGSPAATQGQTESSEKIEIDGSKNPEMIPRWIIWDNAFSVVNHLVKPNPNDPLPPHERMGVSKEDWDVILAEAKHQAEQGAQTRRELEPIVRKLQAQNKTMAEIIKATEPIEIENRWEILAGGDRVMALVSPEGAIRLQAWIDMHIVKGMRMSMGKFAYENLRKPR